MSNALIKSTPNKIVAKDTTQLDITQHGKESKVIGSVNNYHDTSTTTNILVMNSQENKIVSNTSTLNNEFYNLFVIGGEEFNAFTNGHFIIQKDRALTENVSPNIKDSVDSLCVDAVNFIKNLPTIFASENAHYGNASDEQLAYFGLVTDIRIQDNGIKIFYQTINPISQKRLNEMLSTLAIAGHDSFNEFNRTHWAIKRVDLVFELRNANIQVFAP